MTVFHLLPYYLFCALSLGIAAYAWNQRRLAAGAAGFAIFALGQAACTLVYTFEVSATTLADKLMWDNIQWMLFMLTPLTWLYFTQTHLGRRFERPRLTWVILIVPLVVIMVLMGTGELRRDIVLRPGEPFSALDYAFTPAMWGMAGYIYVLFFYNLFVLGKSMFRQNNLYRMQAVLVITGVLIPVLGSLVAILFNITVAGQRDLTPFLFTIGNIFIAWGLFRFHFLDVVPIARNHLMESIRDIVIVVDNDNRVLDLNPAARLLAAPGRGVGDDLLAVFPQWRDSLETYQRSDTTYIEITSKLSENLLSIDLHISPVLDRHGRRLGQVLVGREMTEDVVLRNELIETIRQLAETQERFDQLVNNLPGMTYIYGHQPDGQRFFTFVSDQSRELSGVNPEAIYADASLMNTVTIPEYQAQMVELEAASKRNLTQFHAIMPVTVGGTIRWHEMISTPKQQEDGSTIWHGIQFDVTERKKTEDDLRESEERFKSAFTSSPVGMTLVSMEGRFLQVNRAFCQIVGYTEAQLLNTFYQDITHPDDLAEDGEQNELLISGEINNFSIEKRYLHQSGQVVWTQLSVSLLRDPAGTPLYYVAQVLDINERRNMEIALREREERFKGAFEFSPVGMALVDMDARYLQVNRAFCDMLGYTEAELLATTFRAITHPDDLLIDVQENQRLRAGLINTYNFEKRYLHKAGHTVWAQVSASLLRDADGTPRYHIVQMLDINERKQMEIALREREERFKGAFEFSPIGMTLVGLNGRFIQVNRAVAVMLGYSEIELLETDFPTLTHPDDLEADLGNVQTLLDGKTDNFSMEKRYFHKDGHIVWAQLSVSLVHDAAGAPLYFVSQIIDITERKQMETALREREQRFKSAFEFSPIGMTLVGLNGRFLQVNRAFCEMLGYTEAEILTTDFLRLTHPDDAQENFEQIQVLIAGTAENVSMEKRYFHKDGHIVWGQLNMSLVQDSSNIPLYFVTQIVDITERRATEQTEREKLQLRTALEKEQELSELKTQMMIRIGHEFRIPLTVIQTAGEMLDVYLERMSPEKRREKITQIYDQVDRLTQMLNDISYIVRGQAAADLEMNDFALLDLCEDIAAKYQGQREVLVRQHGDVGTIHADRRGIRAVLEELLSNAVKYSPEASPIWIDVTCDNGELCLSVIDEGIGVPPDDYKRVFEPFYRAGNIGEIGGLGLGLTIVRDIVQLHGGEVSVFNVGDQAGLCVVVRLPSACLPVSVA